MTESSAIGSRPLPVRSAKTLPSAGWYRVGVGSVSGLKCMLYGVAYIDPEDMNGDRRIFMDPLAGGHWTLTRHVRDMDLIAGPVPPAMEDVI